LAAGTGISVSGATISGNYTASNGVALSGAALSADAAWLKVDGNVFTAGTGITNSAGTLAVNLAAGTGISVSGATISGNYAAGDGIEISGNEIALDASFLRFSASNVSLTADTAYTVTHNLGMKLVQTAFLRTSDSKKIDLEVTFSSTTALSIKSSVNVTIDIAVSV
jgi:hypothetical protein